MSGFLFAYCLNNPLIYTDPTGQTIVGDFFKWVKKNTWDEFWDAANNFAQWADQNGIPAAGYGYNSSLGSYHYLGNSGNVYHSQVRGMNNAPQVVENAVSEASYGGGGSLMDDTWSWAKDHFYIGAEGEITYGLQVAATLKNGLGFNISPYHVVRAEGSWDNKNRPIPKFKSNEKLKIHDYGVAYYVGVNYNQTIDYSRNYNGIKTNTISVGAFGVVGVTLNFSENWNFINGYGGVDISGKAAVIWGASGSLKLGFEF